MTFTAEKELSLGRALFSRALHTYFLMRRGLTIGVRAIVQSDDGKFLLVRHTYTVGWHFPGGGVEKGETAGQALRNELLQEAGLKIANTPILHGVFHNDGVSKRDHVLAYLCDAEGDLDAKPTSIEIAEFRYFDFEDLPPDTDPGTVRRINEVVLGNLKTESW
ncbi:NUDIX domain-containing protein [Planktotalea sp.]|uniref:NUDIX domain-containing protein n=1 Tax=Planktotalea sp. TaxID=2029877 RepID=UPI0035C7C065